MTYVVVHKRTGRPVLIYAGRAVEFWTVDDYRKRFEVLGYELFELLDDPMPVEMMKQALQNLEED